MQAVLASTVAIAAGGRSWWNRPMAWASLAAIGYGGWLAVRRGQRRAEREAAEDQARDLAPAAESNPMDEAMNRLGRDWHPEG
ncbi:MAG: hypothetical protein ACJ786_00375 [Catenulispora sp.]